MKSCAKECSIFAIQCFMFYIFPCFAGPTDTIGMVLLILLATLILSVLIGCLSGKVIKYLYPFAVSLAFIPSVFIHYNESALVHAVWYLIIAAAGLCYGAIIRKLLPRRVKK